MKRIIINVVTATGFILFVISIGRATQHIISSRGEDKETVYEMSNGIPANALGVDMAMVKKVLGNFGSGKNDAMSGMDGKNPRHNNKSEPTALPKTLAHADERRDMKYWNTYIANLESGKQEIYNELLNEVQK